MSDDYFKSSVFTPEEVERRKRVEEERKKNADAAKKSRAQKEARDSARAKMNAEIAAEYQKALSGEQPKQEQQIPNLRKNFGLPTFTGTPSPGQPQGNVSGAFKLKRW